MIFKEEEFEAWKENCHIPQDVFGMVQFIAEKIGYGNVEEETISIRNRVGQVIGLAKGFSISHCTSSYEDGPSIDYSSIFKKWLTGLNFEIENSYGDNGMDCSTNLHDTYWTNEFIYTPSQVLEDDFIMWEEKDYV